MKTEMRQEMGLAHQRATGSFLHTEKESNLVLLDVPIKRQRIPTRGSFRLVNFSLVHEMREINNDHQEPLLRQTHKCISIIFAKGEHKVFSGGALFTLGLRYLSTSQLRGLFVIWKDNHVIEDLGLWGGFGFPSACESER